MISPGSFPEVTQSVSVTVQSVTDGKAYVLKDKYALYPVQTTLHTYSKYLLEVLQCNDEINFTQKFNWIHSLLNTYHENSQLINSGVTVKPTAAPKQSNAILTCAVTLTKNEVNDSPFKFEWFKRGSTELKKSEEPANKVCSMLWCIERAYFVIAGVFSRIPWRIYFHLPFRIFVHYCTIHFKFQMNIPYLTERSALNAEIFQNRLKYIRNWPKIYEYMEPSYITILSYNVIVYNIL